MKTKTLFLLCRISTWRVALILKLIRALAIGHFSATGTRLCCKSTHCCTRALNISRHLFIIQIHTKLLFQLDSTHCTIIALYYCYIADCNLQCSVIMTFHAFSIFINESCRLLIFKGLKVSFFLDIFMDNSKHWLNCLSFRLFLSLTPSNSSEWETIIYNSIQYRNLSRSIGKCFDIVLLISFFA